VLEVQKKGSNFIQKRWPAAMLILMLQKLKARTKVLDGIGYEN